MTEQGGLRERKKAETRERIRAAALSLFGSEGFAAVPITRIAAAAEVSPATVFNYFATKEDLIYGGMEAFEDELINVVRSRPAGTTVFEAFRDHVLRPKGLLASSDPAATASMASVARIIADSPALQARERQITDRATDRLARLVAEEYGVAPSSVDAWVIANALVGVNRAITRGVHDGAMRGRTGRQIARSVLGQARRAFDALEAGLERTLVGRQLTRSSPRSRAEAARRGSGPARRRTR